MTQDLKTRIENMIVDCGWTEKDDAPMYLLLKDALQNIRSLEAKVAQLEERLNENN